jgi:hypothetical protein
MSETRVRFADRVLTDTLYENAVDRYQLRARRRNVAILAVVVVVLALIVWKILS